VRRPLARHACFLRSIPARATPMSFAARSRHPDRQASAARTHVCMLSAASAKHPLTTSPAGEVSVSYLARVFVHAREPLGELGRPDLRVEGLGERAAVMHRQVHRQPMEGGADAGDVAVAT
jgi:hypothetical protein